jgi:hypothetical protein
MVKRTVSNNLFIRILLVLVKSCLIGLLAGAVSGAVGGGIYWISSEIYWQNSYTLIELMELIAPGVFGTGIPLGLLIGASTGLHHLVFSRSNPKSFVWAVIACLAAVLGLWLSGLDVASQSVLILRIAFDFEIAMIGLVTGWITHRSLMPDFKDDNEGTRREIIISSFSGLSLMVIVTASYFRYLLGLFNIIA